MTIYIDVSPAVHQRAGLARYSESLVRALLRQRGHERSIGLFYNRDRQAQPLAGLSDVPVRTVHAGYKPWRMAAWAGHLAGIGFDRLVPNAELFHATEHLLMPLRATPTILTVHDLIYRLFPSYHTRLNYWFLNAAMPLFVKHANAIITVSESTKRDLVRLYGVADNKVTVIYEAASPDFRRASADEVAATKRRYGLPERYLLVVGTIEPRKNLIRLVAALRKLRLDYPDLTLVIVGRAGWLYQDFFEDLEKLDDPKAVLLSGFVPDADLPAVMTGATACILASLYEGFGLPILEAMACGTPVVCSRTSSMPELGGDAAHYFDPYEVEDIAAAIAAVAADPDVAEEMRQRGLQQAARFSWEQTADQTFALYERVMTSRPT